jgi:hypothetical protein
MLSDEQIDDVLSAAYTELVATTGYNGGMGGQQWDQAAARAIERAVLESSQPVGQDERLAFEAAAREQFGPAMVSRADLAAQGDRLSYTERRVRDARFGWLAARAAPVAVTEPMEVLTDAARDVLAERKRQISVEGWTPEHDDEHGDCSLARAAACYALGRSTLRSPGGPDLMLWPWGNASWKPGTPRRNLVRAGALILAEIERLDRARILARDSGALNLEN